jgi:hypothetical protein
MQNSPLKNHRQFSFLADQTGFYFPILRFICGAHPFDFAQGKL